MKFQTRIITFYMLLIANGILALENDLSMPEIKIEKIEEIVNNAEINANNIIKEINIEEIIKKTQKQLEISKKQEKERNLLTFKKENIPLISSGLIKIPIPLYQEDEKVKWSSSNFKLGLYKKDMVNIGLSAANISANYYIFSKIQALHIKKATTNIINDYKEIKKFLKEIDIAIDNNKNKYTTINELNEAIKSWTYHKHGIVEKDLFGINLLLNKQTGPLIIGKLLFDKITANIESTYSFTDYKMMFSEGLGFTENYEKKPDGTIEKATISTFSPLSIIRFFTNGKLFRARWREHISKIVKGCLPDLGVFSSTNKISFLNNLLPIKIPTWLFDAKLMSVLVSFKNMYYGVATMKIIDNYYSYKWSTFVVKNYKQLIELIEKYEIIKEKEDSEKPAFSDDLKAEILETEDQINKFVLNGHTSGFYW